MKKKLTEMDQKSSVSLTLVLRHCHDARDVILLLTKLLLGKVADQVATLAIIHRQYIKEERFDVIVKRLVIEKELCQKAEILAIDLVDVAIHLKDGQVIFSVDFSGRGVPPQALGHVPIQNGTTLHVLETKLAQEQF